MVYPEMSDELKDADYGEYMQTENVSGEDVAFVPYWYMG